MHLANRVHHCFVYGLVFRFRLLSTPPLNDAVTFRYGQASVPVRKGLSPFCWCVLSGAHVPGTSCQATIALSLRGLWTSAKNGLFSCFWTIKTACPPFKNACTGILERRLFQNDQSPTAPSGTKSHLPGAKAFPDQSCRQINPNPLPFLLFKSFLLLPIGCATGRPPYANSISRNGTDTGSCSRSHFAETGKMLALEPFLQPFGTEIATVETKIIC